MRQRHTRTGGVWLQQPSSEHAHAELLSECSVCEEVSRLFTFSLLTRRTYISPTLGMPR